MLGSSGFVVTILASKDFIWKISNYVECCSIFIVYAPQANISGDKTAPDLRSLCIYVESYFLAADLIFSVMKKGSRVLELMLPKQFLKQISAVLLFVRYCGTVPTYKKEGLVSSTYKELEKPVLWQHSGLYGSPNCSLTFGYCMWY